MGPTPPPSLSRANKHTSDQGRGVGQRTPSRNLSPPPPEAAETRASWPQTRSACGRGPGGPRRAHARGQEGEAGGRLWGPDETAQQSQGPDRPSLGLGSSCPGAPGKEKRPWKTRSRSSGQRCSGMAGPHSHRCSEPTRRTLHPTLMPPARPAVTRWAATRPTAPAAAQLEETGP